MPGHETGPAPSQRRQAARTTRPAARGTSATRSPVPATRRYLTGSPPAPDLARAASLTRYRLFQAWPGSSRQRDRREDSVGVVVRFDSQQPAGVDPVGVIGALITACHKVRPAAGQGVRVQTAFGVADPRRFSAAVAVGPGSDDLYDEVFVAVGVGRLG